jgi:hypothetical protein
MLEKHKSPDRRVSKTRGKKKGASTIHGIGGDYGKRCTRSQKFIVFRLCGRTGFDDVQSSITFLAVTHSLLPFYYC